MGWVEGPLRVWPSFAELAASADSGCDICMLVRQYLTTLTSVAILHDHSGEVRLHANRRNLSVEMGGGSSAYVIAPLNEVDGDRETRLVLSAPSRDRLDIFQVARSWLNQCILHDRDCGEGPGPDGWNAMSRLPRRLLDLSHGSSIIVVNVAEWLALGLATEAELSEYCTLSYRWGSSSHECVLADDFDMVLELPLDTDANLQGRHCCRPQPRHTVPLDRCALYSSA